MKKFFTLLTAILVASVSSVGYSQNTSKAQKESSKATHKTEKMAKEDMNKAKAEGSKMEKSASKEARSVEKTAKNDMDKAKAEGTKMEKSASKDVKSAESKIENEGKHLKKDGTPDKRYKENKTHK